MKFFLSYLVVKDNSNYFCSGSLNLSLSQGNGILSFILEKLADHKQTETSGSKIMINYKKKKEEEERHKDASRLLTKSVYDSARGSFM